MNKNFQLRKDALALIKNIRTVRHLVKTGTFNDTLFDSINGDDRALESLVDHKVVFAMLTDNEKSRLRSEILNKLASNESAALDKIREAMESYFKEIDTSIQEFVPASESYKVILDKAGTIDAERARAIATGSVDTGCMRKEGIPEGLNALEKVTDFLNAITPVLFRVIDSDEPNEIPEEESSTAAPEEAVEPEPVETEEVGHQVLVNPNEENIPALQEMEAVANHNISVVDAQRHMRDNGGDLSELGYHSVKDVTNSIRLISDATESYMNAVKSFRSVLPVATCTSEDLLRGSSTFYSTVESLMCLINKCEYLRDGLETTVRTLADVLQTLEK